ncbi:hypothetical protein BH11BAC4_BH11BAC4_26120 [soil metagenome]
MNNSFFKQLCGEKLTKGEIATIVEIVKAEMKRNGKEAGKYKIA